MFVGIMAGLFFGVVFVSRMAGGRVIVVYGLMGYLSGISGFRVRFLFLFCVVCLFCCILVFEIVYVFW